MYLDGISKFETRRDENKYRQYPIVRNGDQAPPVGFLKNSPI